MANEIATVNDIAAIDVMENSILMINDPDTAEDFIKKMDVLEKLLKAAEMFNEKARQYARLEALAFVRIVNLGMAEQIPAKDYRRQTALWLANELDEIGREQVISECGEQGVTIHYYYKNVVKEAELTDWAISDYRWRGGMAIAEFKEKGKVSLNEWFDVKPANKRRLPYDFVKGFEDRVRMRIRDLGGHGTGDGQGTYMTVEQANWHITDIIETKTKSILRDINRLRQVFGDEAVRTEQHYADIRREVNFNDDLSDESAVSVLFCLCNIATPYWCTETDEGRLNMVLAMLEKLGIDTCWLYSMLKKDAWKYEEVA